MATFTLPDTTSVGESTKVPVAAGSFDLVAAYTVLRLALGMSMFVHGLSRFVAGIDKYAAPTIAGFNNVALPHGMVVFAVYLIPYAEAVLGVLLLAGLLTRFALLGTAALILLLMFGAGMEQNWTAVAAQLPYPLIIAVLLATESLNGFSLDRYLKKT